MLGQWTEPRAEASRFAERITCPGPDTRCSSLFRASNKFPDEGVVLNVSRQSGEYLLLTLQRLL